MPNLWINDSIYIFTLLAFPAVQYKNYNFNNYYSYKSKIQTDIIVKNNKKTFSMQRCIESIDIKTQKVYEQGRDCTNTGSLNKDSKLNKLLP